LQKRKCAGGNASIRQSPHAFAETEKSDRIETGQRIWRIAGRNGKTVGHIHIGWRTDTQEGKGNLSLYILSTKLCFLLRFS
jgi:hypothetical protein